MARYEVLEKIGAGGMGEVFLAHDTSLDRRVALKRLPKNVQEDETARKRFVREAKSAAALDHPYICKIFEIGEDDDGPFIAMEYVRGETLQERLSKGDVPPDDVRRIASEIAEALETAHAEGIIHRDLKPSNVMLTEDGHVKVMDFGLAKKSASAPATSEEITGEGATLGTVAYMSPEQLRAQPLDARSDIFSFGVVLYEMATGRHPFRKKTAMDTAAAILNQPPPATSNKLNSVARKMLAKSPAERFDRVRDLRAELARDETRRRPIPKLAATLSAALGLLALATWLFVGSSTPRSVAVLPFENVSDDRLESDYLAHGITRAVITKLSQAGIRVSPWDTVRRYEGRIHVVEDIASELNVDSVLMGTFELVDDRIVTTLSLIDGDSGLQSWADQLEEPFEDIFLVQGRIAAGAAASLKRRLSGEDEAVLAEPESRSVDAYDFYMQGAYLMDDGTREATEIAHDYFQRAVELDPELVKAHIGVGVVEHERYLWGWGGGPENFDRAQVNFERALALEPGSMEARRGLMQVNFLRGHVEAVLVQGREAAKFGREQDVETLLTRATAFQLGGPPDRSRPLLHEVVRIDPENIEAHWRLVAGRDPSKDAIDAGNTYLQRFGDDPETHMYLAMSLQFFDADKALEHYEKAIGQRESGVDSPRAERVPEAMVFGGLLLERLGNPDRARELWQLGVDVYAAKVEESPQNGRMILMLACFYGLLGDDAAMHAAAERARVGESPWAGNLLAMVHLKRGETERAVELLHDGLRAGFAYPNWSWFFHLTELPTPESEGFQSFVREYEAEIQRLRDTY